MLKSAAIGAGISERQANAAAAEIFGYKKLGKLFDLSANDQKPTQKGAALFVLRQSHSPGYQKTNRRNDLPRRDMDLPTRRLLNFPERWTSTFTAWWGSA